MTSNLKVRELQAQDEAIFLEGLIQHRARGEALHWYTFAWSDAVPFSEMLERLRKDRDGEDLPPDRVPHTMLYGFLDGKIVGRVSVRHELNALLLRRGGHIGYWIAPEFRRMGLASEMFQQAVQYCRSLGLKRIMATCDDSNHASWKLLERKGAKLEEIFFDSEDGSTARRYWLDLGSSTQRAD